MKIRDMCKLFCTDKKFDNTVYITIVNGEEILFNTGDDLQDLDLYGDLGDKTIDHCYVAETCLFIEAKERYKKAAK